MQVESWGGAKALVDEVTGALEGLSAVLDREDDLGVTLHEVCAQAMHAIPRIDLASISMFEEGRPYTVAASDPRVQRLDEDQYATGEGPCLLAAATGRIVRAEQAQARRWWPLFTAANRAEGVASFLSGPLVVQGQFAGTLNLYSYSPVGNDELEAALLELYLTAVEAILRAKRRYVNAKREVRRE